MSHPDYNSVKKLKFAVVGRGGVGKYSLLRRFIPTDDGFRKQVTVGKRTCDIEIVDPRGEEDFSTRKHNMRIADACLLVYDITNRESFEALFTFVEELLNARITFPSIVFAICGNKCDLSAERQVKKEEVMELFKEFGCPFFETSAKTGENVEECFVELARCWLYPKGLMMNRDRERKDKCIIC